jgi:hypothetical protein
MVLYHDCKSVKTLIASSTRKHAMLAPSTWLCS